MINDLLCDDEIDEIIEGRSDKDLFVPKTKEDLLKYSDESYMDNKESEYYSQLVKYLSKRSNSKNKEDYAYLYASGLLLQNRIDSKIDNDNNPFDSLDKMGFFIKDENDAQKFLNLYMNCANNTRMYSNKGWTPQELIQMTPKVDIDKMTLGIGDGMKKMFRDQDFDVEDALNNVRNSDLPKGIKESLINEFETILQERKNKA